MEIGMKRLLILVSVAALLTGSAAAAPMAAMSAPSNAQGSLDPLKQTRKTNALKALREEALKQQATDGGKLTDEHRAEFQRKMDAIRSGNY
jgi:hypothetical protein